MVAPDYRVIAIDETHNWDEAITAITGKIAGVYVVNFAEVTHCCSITPAYWAEFLCNITEHYVREPDGYQDGEPIWDEDCDPDALARGKALVAAWKGDFHGIAYEGASESSSYYERLNPDHGSKIDMAGAGWPDTDALDMSDWTEEQKEKYRKERDDAALEAAQEYMNNGEEWSDIAPWNRKENA